MIGITKKINLVIHIAEVEPVGAEADPTRFANVCEIERIWRAITNRKNSHFTSV